MLPDDTPCDVMAQYNSFTPLHAAQWIMVITSIISLVLVIFSVAKYVLRSMFEQVFKELLMTLYFFIALHSVVLAILQGTIITVRAIHVDDPCEAQISKIFCYSLRITTTIPMSGIVCIHAAITVQRIVSTFSPDTGLQRIIGRGMIILSFVYSIGIAYFTYMNDDFSGRVPYCSGSTKDSQELYTINLCILLAMDIITCTIDFVVLRYNQRKLKNQSEKSFVLAVTFRRRQNVYSIQQFLPSAVFHALCYGVLVGIKFFAFTFRDRVDEVTYVTIVAYTYVLPYYCMICPIILLFMMRKGKLHRRARILKAIGPSEDTARKESYFQSLHDQWDMHFAHHRQ